MKRYNKIFKFDLLKNHPDTIPTLSKIWHEGIGKKWFPDLTIKEIERLTYEELEHDISFTYIALNDKTPVGLCTFKLSEDFKPDLGPWIADLVVNPKYQKQGIGKILLKFTLEKAKDLGFRKLYLFTFNHNIQKYYEQLGWKKIGMDKFKRLPVTIMEINL